MAVLTRSDRLAHAWRWPILLAIAGVLATPFVVHAYFPPGAHLPSLFNVFNWLTLLGALVALTVGWRGLQRRDWAVALSVGALLGALVPGTRYLPFWDTGQALSTGLTHGLALALVLLGGLSVMRRGGPIRLRLVGAALVVKPIARSLVSGVVAGLPLAILNVVAFTVMQGQAAAWRAPLAAAVHALQPALVEEAFYRLALLSFLWVVLQLAWPRHATLLAATLSLLVHNYSHFGPLLHERPLFALGYGALVGLFFGLPMTALAVRRDLESAIGCHWVVDWLRFAAGF
jgi:hypothetical protein